jgi:tetratricopeptide (TPR) repeat protein
MAENPRDRLWPPNKFLGRLAALIAISCCLILIVASFIGVIRGYSVQSTIFWFLPSVVLISASFYFPRKKSFIQGLKDSFKPSLENLFCAVFCVYTSIGLFQGRHYDKGYKFYEQGLYNEAAVEFEKETRLWYLKISYNTSESSAMQKLAESYCQLEDYDKAISVYELIISRYQGPTRELASLYLQPLKNGLRFIDQCRGKEHGFDYNQLYDMARIHEDNLNSYKRAITIYKQITEMDIPAEDKKNAYEAIKRLTPAMRGESAM